MRGAVLLQGPELPPDGVFDIEIARDLQHGDLRAALLRRFHPLGGALAASVAALLGREADETCGLVVSVVAGCLAAFFTALAAGRLATRSPRFAALAAGLLVAVHPALARSAAVVWSYPLSHAALAAALAASARALALGSLPAAFAAGLAAGVAYLARPDGLVIAAGLFAGLVFASVRANAPFRGAGRVLAPLLVVAGFAVAAVPYVLALHDATGEWRLTLKKDERHLVGMRDPHAPPPAPRAADDLGAIIARAEEMPDPGETGLAASALYVIRRSGESAHWLLVVLGAAGLALTARGQRAPSVLVLLALLGAHMLLKANERHFNPNHASADAIVLALWSGVALAPFAASRRARTLLLGAAVAVLLVKTRDASSVVKTKLTRDVAAALREKREPGRELVLCGSDARPLAHLAGARLLEMPRGDAASVASHARGAGARFLAVYVRTRGEPPAPVTSALAGAGLPAPLVFTETRPARNGSILYTWLVYDLTERR